MSNSLDEVNSTASLARNLIFPQAPTELTRTDMIASIEGARSHFGPGSDTALFELSSSTAKFYSTLVNFPSRALSGSKL